MKSFKILIAVFALAVTAGVSAQEKQEKVEKTTKSKSFAFGLKGGANFTTIAGPEHTPDVRTSFHAGVFVEMPISDKFSFQIEGLYSEQGFDLDFDGPDNDRAQVQLDYINVPVLARVYVTKWLSVDAGPQFSFLVQDELDLNPYSNSGDYDLGAFDPNHFDVGLAGGLTFQTGFGLFVSARYTYGLTKLYDTGKGNGDIAFDGFHNQVYQASLGYKF